MSAEASSSPRGVWESLEGHVVNGAFPLRRFLGSSDHSGVFLTEAAKHAPAVVAIKLVPVIATPTQVQLSRWLTAARLAHPHLLRMFEAGKCDVEGLHYLYVVMEYADQTLAQLLESRALTEDEAREMLVPTLGALAFLHGKGFVQGHLRPSNVLVVGDQLKLASDTNRPVDEVGERVGTLSLHHPPEARDGRCSTEGDIWALGVTVCEALTRRQPLGLRSGGDAVVLPPDLPVSFKELVARCLSRSAQDRPAVGNVEAWTRGKSLPPVPVAIPDSAAMALLETPASQGPATLDPAGQAPSAASLAVPPNAAAASAAGTAKPGAAAHNSASSVAARSVASAGARGSATPQREVAGASDDPASVRILPMMFVAFAVFVLAWAGIRAIRPGLAPAPTQTAAPAEPRASDAMQTRGFAELPREAISDASVEPPGYAEMPVEAEPESVPEPVVSAGPDASSGAIREVMPEVPRGARLTIRGTIRISVRLIVDPDGTVFAAISDDPGPSRYFERLAIDAAKQWTFPAADTSGQRLVQVRFAITRNGTTARAVPLR